jgi:GTP cyclohydrolase II
MLAALSIFELDLLSNNPDKAAQLRTLGLTMTQHVPTGVFTTAHNVRYLRTKVVHTQHTLTELTELTAG